MYLFCSIFPNNAFDCPPYLAADFGGIWRIIELGTF